MAAMLHNLRLPCAIPLYIRSRRLTLTRLLAVVALVFLAVILVGSFGPYLLGESVLGLPLEKLRLPPSRMPNAEPTPQLDERVTCFGPRNLLLSNSPDDELQSLKLDIPYPKPFVGSFKELGLEETWITADARYGPYGYGENSDSHGRTRVDWDAVDWGMLQNDCFERNRQRFPKAARGFDPSGADSQMSWRNRTRLYTTTPRWNDFGSTRRTALVVRAYDGYEYKTEDLTYLRSLIVEAGLRTGGEYVVVLLINIKDNERDIFRSEENYRKALDDANVPRELRSIAVLWDENLLTSWYPLVGEYRTMWQVYQPLQLFALHFPQFDHYWQLELDQRFMGDAGKYLDAVSSFARNEPRKQALERATFLHVQDEVGSYRDLLELVNATNKGASHIWGPLTIPDIERPIGPVPPSSPFEDDFKWGVGEEADFISTSFCQNVTAAVTWDFRDWIGGFELEGETPRWFCPPAIQRASRSLLLAIHEAQLRKGAKVPSEATLPSFALWHGLKISYPPQPWYLRDRDSEDERKLWFMGGPKESLNGFGMADPQKSKEITWWWTSSWTREIVDKWLANNSSDEGMPYVLGVHDGQVYIPNIAMHPVKRP